MAHNAAMLSQPRQCIGPALPAFDSLARPASPFRPPRYTAVAPLPRPRRADSPADALRPQCDVSDCPAPASVDHMYTGNLQGL